MRLSAAALQPLALERAEVAADRRAAELVVERGGADRPFDHDVERGGDALRLAEIALPRPLVAGNAQVRDRKSRQARLGLRAGARGALVANLTARAGRRAGKGRDRGRMIVRLHLHQNVDGLAHAAIDAARRLREIAHASRSFDHRGVVAIGGEHAARAARVGVADHREQRLVARPPVDDPVGVEDLVAAVLGVRLREHHELDVGGIAAEPAEILGEVLDLVRREREAQLRVRFLERGDRHRGQRARLLHARRAAPPRRLSNSTISVMRSNKGAASAARRSRPKGRDARMRYSMPRSMRRTASSPQTCAMSVALLDQGEMVPARGTTSSSSPSGASSASMRGP